jgi:lia operon protein LiaG
MSNGINTKKLAIILGIIFIVSGLISGVLFYSEYVVPGFSPDIFENYDSSNNIDTEKKTDLNGISEISIETSSTDISLINADSNEIKAHFYGNYSCSDKSFKPELSFVKNGSKLLIKVEDSVNGFVMSYRSNLKIDIYIPSKYSESIKVISSSGDVRSERFSVSEFTVNTTSGDIKTEAITAEKAHFGSSSGKINFNGRFTELNVKSTSGDIGADSVEADNSEFESSSGSIRFNGKLTEVSAKSTSGDIISDSIDTKHSSFASSSGRISVSGSLPNIAVVSTSGDISITSSADPKTVKIATSSGATRLKLPGSAGFKLDCKSSSGDINSDFPVTIVKTNSTNDHELNGTVGDGSGDITITSTSGDIRILK